MEDFKFKAKTKGCNIELQTLEIKERIPVIKTIATFKHFRVGEKILVKVLS